MKRYIKYLFVPVILSVAASCLMIEEEQIEVPELLSLTFKATMEDNHTKNTLMGDLDDPFRSLYWLPTDEIAVYTWNNNYAKFKNISADASKVADFAGEGVDKEPFYAVYPYSSVTSWNGSTSPCINVPVKQTYAVNTFATDMFPMVARAYKGESFQFKNVCGMLVVNLKGEETVKTVSLAAYDKTGSLAKIAGTFNVDLSYETVPSLSTGADSIQGTMIELDCGDGVKLSTSDPTSFYFVLAPGEYSRIAVFVTTTDGKTMVKEGRNPLTIKRSEWISAGALQYAESVSIDLSENGNSNCYIVSKAGAYHFDANVIGNGEHGFIETVNFHTTTPNIAPAAAEILWEDRQGILTAVALDDNKITFLATGQEGNALIAAKDENGNVLWSWHIWVTEQPEDQIYINDRGSFTMQDRNLGAIRADLGGEENWQQSVGNIYQWGRKDPCNLNVSYDQIGSQITVVESIQYPTTFVFEWSGWCKEPSDTLWSGTQKTIYDPCPVGYRVPVKDVWYGFTADGVYVDRVSLMNVSGQFNYGWNFIYDGVNTTWYPSVFDTAIGRYHSSTKNSSFEFQYSNDLDCYVNPNKSYEGYYRYAIRCMKDEGHVDTSYPTVKIIAISEVTSSSATLVANVTDEGISEIIERGVIWGLSEDITLENADNATCDPGNGEYTMTIDGLSHSTRYYIKAYAINEKGVSYSKAKSFYTPYEGNAVNLSRNGTANCYIVPVAYSDYVFNASVKGNSNESVGSVASVEVLWETRNDRNTINVGDVIETVELEGNNVKFRLPFDPKPGNALIAVKDANGTILWSWHIWVVDYDPVATQQKYISGAIMMDRNLGALSVVPGDIGALGFMYQWGRKDPFVGSGMHANYSDCFAYTAPYDAISYVYFDSANDSIEYSVKNPTVVYNDAAWSNANDLWGYNKTKYDPCPAGWRVSDKSAWEGLVKPGNAETYHVRIPEPYSTPEAYFPTTGYTDGSYYLHGVPYGAYFWNTDRESYTSVYYSDNPYLSARSVDCMHSVRCMKDSGNTKPGSGDDVIVDDEYEW